MKVTMKRLGEILSHKFKEENFPPCNCRNGHPATGWQVIGHSGLTQAIKMSGLPWNFFWSGSNPTPSTQSPEKIIIEAEKYI